MGEQYSHCFNYSRPTRVWRTRRISLENSFHVAISGTGPMDWCASYRPFPLFYFYSWSSTLSAPTPSSSSGSLSSWSWLRPYVGHHDGHDDHDGRGDHMWGIPGFYFWGPRRGGATTRRQLYRIISAPSPLFILASVTLSSWSSLKTLFWPTIYRHRSIISFRTSKKSITPKQKRALAKSFALGSSH